MRNSKSFFYLFQDFLARDWDVSKIMAKNSYDLGTSRKRAKPSHIFLRPFFNKYFSRLGPLKLIYVYNGIGENSSPYKLIYSGYKTRSPEGGYPASGGVLRMDFP